MPNTTHSFILYYRLSSFFFFSFFFFFFLLFLEGTGWTGPVITLLFFERISFSSSSLFAQALESGLVCLLSYSVAGPEMPDVASVVTF